MDTKSWWQSKTIWGVIVAFLAQILKSRGVDIAPESPQLVDGILNVVSFVGTILAIYGRVRATKLIAPKTDTSTIAGGPRLPLLIVGALCGSMLFTGCADKTLVRPNSPAAAVGTDFQVAATQALNAYAEYKAGNKDITWALTKMFSAYSLYAQTSPDVKALIKAWTGNTGDSQDLADKLARIFGASTAPPETKMAALAQIAQDVAAAPTSP